MAERGNLQARLNAGIEAVHAGDLETARRLLQQVLSADPNNDVAWMWMASAVTTVAERRACLERALRSNPNNERAREALRRLEVKPDTRPGTVDLRETELRRARRIEQQGGGGGTNMYFILAGIVLLFVIIAAVLLLNSQDNTPPTALVAQPTADLPVVTSGPSPVMPTLTLHPASIVTLDPSLAMQLPATFTPTFTPTATDMPPATATPVPLVAYQFYYVGAQPNQTAGALYSVRGDSSQDVEQGSESNLRDLALSPDGERLVFVRDSRTGLDTGADDSDEPIPEAGLPQLFVAPRDDLGAAVQITQSRGRRLESPQWSPDGTHIAFAGDLDGDDLNIYVIAASGGEPVRLTDNPGTDTHPAWSPDGRRIAFASDRGTPAYGDYPGSLEIFAMNSDGSNVVQLTDATNESFWPTWSPDGESIVFVSDRSGDNDLYIMDANGEGENLLTFDDNDAEDRRPVFTSDGKWIAFVSNREDERFQIYLVDPRGVTVMRVTNNDRDIQSVVVVPGIS